MRASLRKKPGAAGKCCDETSQLVRMRGADYRVVTECSGQLGGSNKPGLGCDKIGTIFVPCGGLYALSGIDQLFMSPDSKAGSLLARRMG